MALDENQAPVWLYKTSKSQNLARNAFAEVLDLQSDESMPLDNGDLYGENNLEKRRVISDLDESIERNAYLLRDSANIFLKESKVFQDQMNQLSKHPTQLNQVNQLLEKFSFDKIQTDFQKEDLLTSLKNVLEKLDFVLAGEKDQNQVFEKFFRRKYDETSKDDSNILQLVNMFENQKRAMQRKILTLQNEIKDMKNEFFSSHNSLKSSYQKALDEVQHKNQVLEHKCNQLDSQDNKQIVEQVCQILALKNPNHLVKAVQKLEKVLRAVPHLEAFIKEICNLVQHSTKTKTSQLEEVVPQLKHQLTELSQLKKFKHQLTTYLSLPKNTTYEEILKHSAFSQKFCLLFEVETMSQAEETMNSVFLTIQELSNFLKVARKKLKLPQEASMESVLMHLKSLF